MQKMVLSILIDNTPGALSRVVGLFSRRGYNIDSLTVGETENTEVSRMTVAVTGDGIVLEQIEKQIHKLENVIDVEKLTSEASVCRELILVKVAAARECDRGDLPCEDRRRCCRFDDDRTDRKSGKVKCIYQTA